MVSTSILGSWNSHWRVEWKKWTIAYLDLVGGLEHFLFSHILGKSSSQLTNIFQRGSNHQPVDLRLCCGAAMEKAFRGFSRWRRDAPELVDEKIYSKPLLVAGFKSVKVAFQPYLWDELCLRSMTSEPVFLRDGWLNHRSSRSRVRHQSSRKRVGRVVGFGFCWE